MDFVTIIGFISSLVTIEEAGRNWIPMIRGTKKDNTKKTTYTCLLEIDMHNEMVLYAIDSFESAVHEKYNYHLFSEDEIEIIIDGFLEEKKDLRLSSNDRNTVKECIRNILLKYNDDTRSRMSLGEKVIWDKVDRDNNHLKQIDQSLSIIAQTKKSKANSSWFNNTDIQSKGNRPVNNTHIRNFLLGYRYNCNMWGLVFQNKTVWREITNILFEKIQYGGIFALTGPGGEGKTTILMQLSKLLIERNIDVLYYHGYQKPTIPDDISENTVFILDNPSDNYSFKVFVFDVIDQGHTLIIGARDNEWKLLKNSLSIPESVVNTVPLSTLSYTEADSFSKCICKYLHHKKSESEIKDLFINNSYAIEQ